jgi:hypothetical protein
MKGGSALLRKGEAESAQAEQRVLRDVSRPAGPALTGGLAGTVDRDCRWFKRGPLARFNSMRLSGP